MGTKMDINIGTAVSGGISIGKVKIINKIDESIATVANAEVEAEFEKKRFDEAVIEAKAQLNDMYDAALNCVGRENAEIFSIHSMLLDSDEFKDTVYKFIDEKKTSAECATRIASALISDKFAEMDDEDFNLKSVDIKDIAERVFNILSGKNDYIETYDEPVIIMAEELTPSEILKIDKTMVKGIVTKKGSFNSHTAILARALSIPMITRAEIDNSYEDKCAIVDGNLGKYIVDPDENTLKKYNEFVKAEMEQKNSLLGYKGIKNITKSGKEIKLCVNVDYTSDNLNGLDVVCEDVDGIGLFRTENLYLSSDKIPSEEEQFLVYKSVAEKMNGKQVIIRTLDIGSDKRPDYFNFEKEDNPALGFRGIRISLDKPDIFKAQLRAIYRASIYGNVAIMYPMIISIEEVIKIKELSKQVRDELKAEGVEIGHVKEGIMIETPAAALMSDELAKYVEFFSIGTNDLSQYTLAIDRQNSKLDGYYDFNHPEIIKMIRMVADNAHKEGIEISICGELGGDVSLTNELIKIGIDKLSVSPARILDIKKAILESE